MKFKVWNENCKNDKDGEYSYFSLKENKYGDPTLCEMNKNGDNLKGGDILIIDSTFRAIVILDNVNHSSTIKTDVFFSPLVIKKFDIEKRWKEYRDSDAAVSSFLKHIISESSTKTKKAKH